MVVRNLFGCQIEGEDVRIFTALPGVRGRLISSALKLGRFRLLATTVRSLKLTLSAGYTGLLSRGQLAWQVPPLAVIVFPPLPVVLIFPVRAPAPGRLV